MFLHFIHSAANSSFSPWRLVLTFLFTFLQIVSKDLSDPVRSHKDLDKDAAPFFKKAVHFYEELAKQLVSQGHVLDVFASALDQVCLGQLLIWIKDFGYLLFPIDSSVAF